MVTGLFELVILNHLPLLAEGMGPVSSKNDGPN